MTIPLIFQEEYQEEYQEETDYVPRTEQIWIKPNGPVSGFCHISKNLYNEGNYIIRQEFIKSLTL